MGVFLGQPLHGFMYLNTNGMLDLILLKLRLDADYNEKQTKAAASSSTIN